MGHTPGVLSTTTAELGFALMMASARRLILADAYCRSDKDLPENRNPHMFSGQDLLGKVK